MIDDDGSDDGKQQGLSNGLFSCHMHYILGDLNKQTDVHNKMGWGKNMEEYSQPVLNRLVGLIAWLQVKPCL